MGGVHGEALKRLSGIEVIGIQGSTPEKSRQAAERLDLPKAYDNWEALLADDDFGCLLMRFDGGACETTFVTKVTPGRKNCLRYEIARSKAAIEFNSEEPNQLWIGYREKANEILLKDSSLSGDLARRFMGYPGGHAEGFQDSFKMCFRAFYDYIESGGSGTPEFATFEEGLQEIALCEAVSKSAETQAWVDLQPASLSPDQPIRL